MRLIPSFFFASVCLFTASLAAAKDGIVTITPTNTTPFMGVSANVNGPATLKFRARTLKKGDGKAEAKIEILNPGGDKKGEKPQSVAYTLASGDWQEVTVSIPATGPLGIVGSTSPVQQEPVEVDWIELQGAGAKKRWKF